MAMAGKHPQIHNQILFQNRVFGSFPLFRSMMMLREVLEVLLLGSVGGVRAQEIVRCW
jgi:hypothetical protein